MFSKSGYDILFSSTSGGQPQKKDKFMAVQSGSVKGPARLSWDCKGGRIESRSQEKVTATGRKKRLTE